MSESFYPVSVIAQDRLPTDTDLVSDSYLTLVFVSDNVIFSWHVPSD